MKILDLLILLALLLFACAGRCGILIKTCDGEERIVMAGAKHLSQNVEGHVRYYRFWDCALEEWIRGDCPATCTLEVR